MPIKSFRGKIADSTQDTISLHTNNGSTGYRIVKFEILPPDSHENVESTMKVYSVSQTTINDDIDFSDQTLLAAGVILFPQHSSNTAARAVVFDNITFNQDIYITLSGHGYQSALNYYIELEQVKLDLNQNTVATLKDIRNIESQ